VRADHSPPPASPDNHARLLGAFCQAAASGNDAIAIADGGGQKQAALNPIRGADKIIRFLIGIGGKNAGRDIRAMPMVIDGSTGALIYLDDEIDHTLSLAIDGNKIVAIYLVSNPDKLRSAPLLG
jgi:RNA polymerase sigma-70 factor, ECF subfamily